MNASLAWSPAPPPRRSLVIALALALVLHLVLLAVHFSSSRPQLPPTSPLIVQIDLQAVPPSPPPKQAEMIAERDQRAAEPSRAAAPHIADRPRPALAPPEPPPAPPRPEPPPAAETPPEPARETKPAPAPEKGATKAAAQPKPPARPAEPRPAEPPAAKPENSAPTSLTERGLHMARLKSDILQQSLRDDVAARSAVLNANTRYGPEAAYLNAWVAKVEQIGNLNYPDEARRKNLSGRLMLEVKLDAWGKVLSIRVHQSSGEPLLDRAAEEIVRMGAPYAPFPLEMREKLDQVTILRTWAFSPGSLDTR